MSSPNYDYLDGNAAAGELSKVFASRYHDCSGTVRRMWQLRNAWLKPTYTCMVLVLWRDAPLASTYFFVL